MTSGFGRRNTSQRERKVSNRARSRRGQSAQAISQPPAPQTSAESGGEIAVTFDQPFAPSSHENVTKRVADRWHELLRIIRVVVNPCGPISGLLNGVVQLP